MKQLECRVVITHYGHTFALGMFDPATMRHEPLGTHPTANIEKVVRDLKHRMEKEGHRVTFSEITGKR